MNNSRDYSDITVAGNAVRPLINAVRSFSVLVDAMLDVLRVGIREASGARNVDPNYWYPLSDYLLGFQKIEALLGGRGLEKIGTLIPENATFPESIFDVHSVLGSTDVAYHLNHARGGQIMFDMNTGMMLEGIGHYRYEPVAGRNEGRMVVENPYPCRFDLGLMRGLARRFVSEVSVTHDPDHGCRTKGGASCAYLVRW